jgi:hypothetical protein
VSRRRYRHPLSRSGFDTVMFVLPFVVVAVLVTLALTGNLG